MRGFATERIKSIFPKELLEGLKSGKVVIGIIIAIFAVGFFAVEEYWISFITIALLFLLPKLEDLKKLALGTEGLKAEFAIPEKNIEQDIEDNKEEVTPALFVEFREIEERVLFDVHQEIGGEMKQQLHFVYGQPDHPEFSYTPDATIQTDDSLIFVEIKYVLKPELALDIVRKAGQQLGHVLAKFGPSAGKRLVAKLVLVSAHDLSEMNFEVPEGIELKFFSPPASLLRKIFSRLRHAYDPRY